MIFIPGMHFRSLSAALSFPQWRGKWILLLPLCLCSTRPMIHGVHLLTWAGPAFIWVMLLNHVKVLTGRAARLMRNWELGHGTSCQLWSSHTRPQHAALSLADHISPRLWLVIGRFSGKAWSRQTQGITRNTTNIVNSRWHRGMTRSSDDNAGPDTDIIVGTRPEVAREELQKVTTTAITFPDGLLVWDVRLYTFNVSRTNSAIDFALSWSGLLQLIMWTLYSNGITATIEWTVCVSWSLHFSSSLV